MKFVRTKPREHGLRVGNEAFRFYRVTSVKGCRRVCKAIDSWRTRISKIKKNPRQARIVEEKIQLYRNKRIDNRGSVQVELHLYTNLYIDRPSVFKRRLKPPLLHSFESFGVEPKSQTANEPNVTRMSG